jgi:hypothetical protein
MGDELRRTKNRVCFLMIVQNSYMGYIIVISMLKLYGLEDNHIIYEKSIYSLGFCYTDAEISERKATP